MAIETTRWEGADFLDTPEEIAAYLEAAFEDGDPKLITHALGNVARAKGINQLARDAGVTRAGLYKALSADGDPRLTTFLGVLRSLGLTVSVHAAQ
ncbi:addiction module antidote protein [Pelagibacterium sediminicola]|uniref:addiction module antidote protein n=1 Tax=Pelagibacterium sediminicola TaxID=2248761 RepID=UPI000E31EB47|nr:addiction module antidote protein [Pelagibacterium sediminicola]